MHSSSEAGGLLTLKIYICKIGHCILPESVKFKLDWPNFILILSESLPECD